jgi:cytochrome P450
VTSLWYARGLIRGTVPCDILRLHEQYGEIVRIAPDELSYTNPIAWKEIYGHKKSGQAELQKDKKYHAGLGKEPLLINANREYHAFLRKQLSHGFSDGALRRQEPLIQEYLNKLMQQLQDKSQNGLVAVDLAMWFEVCNFNSVS